MKGDYVQAFLEILQEGVPVNKALTGLKHILEKKNHTKLFAPVLREALRKLESERGEHVAVITAPSKKEREAQKAQINAVLKKLGVSEDTTLKEVVDETLVGGFTVTYDYKEYDQSYKKALKSLYESITK